MNNTMIDNRPKSQLRWFANPPMPATFHRDMRYTATVEAVEKKCFLPKIIDGKVKMIMVLHRSGIIVVKESDNVVAVFKITSKGNHYDSRDNLRSGKPGKARPAAWVKSELKRWGQSDALYDAAAEAAGLW
jgi:hypothetical protein